MTEHTPFYYWQRMKAEFKGAKGCNVGFAENELTLRYHDTTVARYYFDTNTLILEHGGWRTHYTKDRINRFCDVLGLDISVWQKNKRFWISIPPGVPGEVFRFVDWGHIDDGDAPEVAIGNARRAA